MCRSIFIEKKQTPNVQRPTSKSEKIALLLLLLLLIELLQRFHRHRFLNFFAALRACPPRVIIPEIKHRLAKMLDDVGAIEVNVFHQCPTILTIKDDVLLLSRWPPTLDHHAMYGLDRGWVSFREIRPDHAALFP